MRGGERAKQMQRQNKNASLRQLAPESVDGNRLNTRIIRVVVYRVIDASRGLWLHNLRPQKCRYRTTGTWHPPHTHTRKHGTLPSGIAGCRLIIILPLQGCARTQYGKLKTITTADTCEPQLIKLVAQARLRPRQYNETAVAASSDRRVDWFSI